MIRITAIIPTFNNDGTVAEVARQTQRFIPDVMIINDGSTDNTAAAIAAVPGADILTIAVNRGKGNALREGFDRALNRGFTHAVTIDADGQHLVEDIPAFLESINRQPEALAIGKRVMFANGIPQPARSRFGKEVGAFWYRFHTGIRLEDTQCGFRAYPLKSTVQLGCRSGKYEYELDLLIRAAWSGIPVIEVPVHMLYLPVEERVSHFRPIRDFLRVSRINAQAAIIRIVMPWRFIDAPGDTVAQKIRNLVLKEIKGGYGPKRSALSLALGILFGLLPIHGFQVAGVMALSFIFKFSKLLCLLGVSVSSAPFLPFWIAAGLGIGKVIVPAGAMSYIVSLLGSHTAASTIVVNLAQWAIGSTVMAIALSIATFVVSYPLFLSYAKIRAKRLAPEKAL